MSEGGRGRRVWEGGGGERTSEGEGRGELRRVLRQQSIEEWKRLWVRDIPKGTASPQYFWRPPHCQVNFRKKSTSFHIDLLIQTLEASLTRSFTSRRFRVGEEVAERVVNLYGSRCYWAKGKWWSIVICIKRRGKWGAMGERCGKEAVAWFELYIITNRFVPQRLVTFTLNNQTFTCHTYNDILSYLTHVARSLGPHPRRHVPFVPFRSTQAGNISTHTHTHLPTVTRAAVWCPARRVCAVLTAPSWYTLTSDKTLLLCIIILRFYSLIRIFTWKFLMFSC